MVMVVDEGRVNAANADPHGNRGMSPQIGGMCGEPLLRR